MPRFKALTLDDRKALEALWDEAGIWIAQTWDRLNAHCFNDEVPYNGVVWGLTPHGGRLGHCSGTGRITLHPALLNPKSDAWGVKRAVFGDRYAADVLVHEMIHALFRARGIPSQPGSQGEHNTRHWCDEIIRITPLLDLKPIQAAPITPRRGVGRVAKPKHLSQYDLSHWPHALRPTWYYTGGNHKMRVPI